MKNIKHPPTFFLPEDVEKHVSRRITCDDPLGLEFRCQAVGPATWGCTNVHCHVTSGVELFLRPKFSGLKIRVKIYRKKNKAISTGLQYRFYLPHILNSTITYLINCAHLSFKMQESELGKMDVAKTWAQNFFCMMSYISLSVLS